MLIVPNNNNKYFMTGNNSFKGSQTSNYVSPIFFVANMYYRGHNN